MTTVELPKVEISLHESQAPILAMLLQTPEFEWGQEMDMLAFKEGIVSGEVMEVLEVIESIKEQLQEEGIAWVPE